MGIGYYIYLIISTFLLVKLNGILKDVGVLTVVIYGIIQVFPIIFIVRSLGKIKDVFNINNSINLKVIIKKVILTIIFSIAIISTTLTISGYNSRIFKWYNLYIFNISAFLDRWLFLFFIKISYYICTHAFFNLVKEKTNSLVAAIIVHELFNFAIAL